MKYHAIQSNTMQVKCTLCIAIPCNTITNNQMQDNAMQYDAMRYHAMQYHAMQSKTIQYMQYKEIPCNTLFKSFENSTGPKRVYFGPWFFFDRFLVLGGSEWAVTVLDEQGVPL